MTTRGWLFLGAVGVLVLALATAQVWFEVQLVDSVRGPMSLTASGSEVTRVSAAAALLAGAALLGGLIGARPVRWLAGAMLVLSGVLAVVAVLGAVGDPVAAVEPVVADRTGVVGGGGEVQAQVTAWPWSAVTGAVCLIGAGVLRIITGPRPADTERDRRTAAPEAGTRGEHRGDWERLSEGEDPTLDDTSGPGPAER